MKKAGKILAVTLLTIIMISFIANFVLADGGDDITEFFTDLIDGIQGAGEPVFTALLGEAQNGGELFTQVLLFLLVVFVIVAVLDYVPFFTGKKWLTWLTSIVVAVFGIRFIPSGLIETITLPSSALALMIGLGMPFLIFFFIIQKIENPAVRKAGWAAFVSIIIFLWIYNWNNSDLDGFRWIYIVALIACIIAFWFDGTLQGWLGKARAKRTIEGATNVQRNRIIAEIRDLEGALAAAPDNRTAGRIKAQINTKKQALDEL